MSEKSELANIFTLKVLSNLLGGTRRQKVVQYRVGNE